PFTVGLAESAEVQAKAPQHIRPKPEEVKDHRPALLVRTIMFANDHRLLPQAWLHGLLYTYATTLIRSSFIIGKYSLTGWWYFFPLTMLFKTPLATLLVGLIVLVGSIVAIAKPQAGSAREKLDGWTI